MGFMLQIRPEVLKKLREDYPTWCHVELVQMFEEPHKDMVPGLTGEVMFVDDDHMNGEFPRLKPGANAISWTGTLTKVVIQPNWRFL